MLKRLVLLGRGGERVREERVRWEWGATTFEVEGFFAHLKRLK